MDLFRERNLAFNIYFLISVMILSFASAVFAVETEEIDKNSDKAISKKFDAGNNNPVIIEADSLEYDSVQNVYYAKGKVKIFYTRAALFADEAELDKKNNVAKAQGNAFLKMGEDNLRGEKILYNIENETGTAYKANAFYARNNFHVRGNKIEKTGVNTYFIEQPAATTCDGDNPDWQLTGRDMKVTIEGYGSMRNACFRIKGVPFLYSPYIIFPAKTKRQTGLLFPHMAYSKHKDGFDIELPLFWTISNQMDATFYQRYLEKRGFKEGAEFRYYIGNKSVGTFYGDFIEDTKHVTEKTDKATSRNWQEIHKRWSYYLNHQTNFDSQFYLRTDIIKVSDKWYFRDFSSHNYYLDNYSKTEENDFKNISFKGDKSLHYLESTARLYKGWSNYNVTGLVNYTEDFTAVNNDQILQRYPKIFLTGIKQPFLNTPLYYELTGEYDYLYREEGDKGHFVDLSPSISMPLNIYNYIKITPQFTFKETFWNGDDNETGSRKRNKNKDKDKTGDRTLYNASVSLGSQLSRIFDLNMDSWEKLRHEIKPEIIYSYVPHVSSDSVPDYYLPVSSPFIKPVPALSGDALMEQNAVAWMLTNTFTVRVKDDAGTYSYLEFFRLKLFQAYDIHEAHRDVEKNDPERKPFSDIGIEFDFNPHKYVSLRMRDKYNFYDGWKQNSYDLHIRDWRGDSLSIGYRNVEDYIEEINLGLKAAITGNIYSTFVWKRNLLNSRKIENSVGLVYHRQCWGIGFDYTETDDDTRFLFKVSLTGFNKLGVQ
ncbi:MAG: LPS-assembly protein LptD [Syntrophaceae bacterium]|nr:LPS-assembly protein LptD [Syntrophaceae bacterium]